MSGQLHYITALFCWSIRSLVFLSRSGIRRIQRETGLLSQEETIGNNHLQQSTGGGYAASIHC